ncbi:hypothetical protein OK016_21280 [Vibrio chagasii]|nr:hypothetical protein [Vibrio chagasii]
MPTEVAVMKDGRLVESNDCQTLVNAPAHPYTQKQSIQTRKACLCLCSSPDSKPSLDVEINFRSLVPDHGAADGAYHFAYKSGHFDMEFTLRKGTHLGLASAGERVARVSRLQVWRYWGLVESEGSITYESEQLQGLNRQQMLPSFRKPNASRLSRPILSVEPKNVGGTSDW